MVQRLPLHNMGGGLYIWDVNSEKLRTVFVGHTARADAIAFWPDENTLASAGYDSTILLWDLTPVLTQVSNQQRNTRGIPWDVNGDGVVNILDLTFIASRFGKDSPDVNGDGIVDILDLVLIANHIEI